jgi:Rrf2 family protein
MSANSRFAVSIHVLAYLAYKQGASVSSAEIAGSVNTNPVVIRRLLSSLTRARLVSAQKGSTGGFSLASAPENISLLDVFRAVEPHPTFSAAPEAPCAKCPVGSKIQATLNQVFFKAQAGMEAELAQITLADIHRQLTAVCSEKK